MSTYTAKVNEVPRTWFVIDLEGKVLGRVATQIADILRGKNKPTFTPHIDAGDFVIVLNASKMVLTGNKLDQKTYYRHTGYPGGIRERVAKNVLQDKPEDIVLTAVRGMLPKNSLSRDLLTKLKVYAGSEHPHQSQAPVAL